MNHGRASSAFCVRTWAAALVCLLGLSSFAFAADAPSVTYSPAGGTVSGGTITKGAPTDFDRLLQGSANLGDVEVRDKAKVRVGTKDVDMVLKRQMPWNKVTKVGAAVLKSLPVVATGVAAWQIYDEFRVRPNGSGGLGFDEGVPQAETTQWCVANAWASTNPPVPLELCGPTRQSVSQQAATIYAATRNAANQGTPAVSVHSVSETGFVLANSYFGGSYVEYQNATVTSYETTTHACPASVDFSDPSLSLPAGLPPGPDGKCRTGRYTTPLTVDEAAAKAVQYGSKARALELANDILNHGGDLTPAAIAPGLLTGPASSSEPSVTTTHTPPATQQNPNPQPETTTSTPTNAITYTNNEFKFSTTNITINNDGSTTTTNAPPSGTDCDKHPSTAGCASLGSPPDAEPLGRENKPIELTPVSFAGGSCPAAVAFSVMGHSYQFEFTPLCDAAATWVKGVLMVCATAMAAFIFVGGLKV